MTPIRFAQSDIGVYRRYRRLEEPSQTASKEGSGLNPNGDYTSKIPRQLDATFRVLYTSRNRQRCRLAPYTLIGYDTRTHPWSFANL